MDPRASRSVVQILTLSEVADPDPSSSPSDRCATCGRPSFLDWGHDYRVCAGCDRAPTWCRCEPVRQGANLGNSLSVALRVWRDREPRPMGAWVKVDPHLRGHVTPSTLAALSRAGFRVHRVGRAAYLHRDGTRWIVGVWARNEPRPAFAARLAEHHRWLIGRGAPTGRERRAIARWLADRTRTAPAAPWWADVDAAGQITTPRSEQPWRLS
jgi:hypothetical protein